MLSIVLNLGSLVALAAAATVNIHVSSSSGALVFNPDSVSANAGDTVLFTWMGDGHTVTQSQSANPCQPQDGGFYSGTQAPPTTFAINVTDTNPLWFYCSTPGHCQAGMVGVINPPSSTTIQQFASQAASAKGNPAPSGVGAGFGGVLGKASSGGSSSSASSAASGSSTAGSSPASASPTASSSSSSGSGSSGGAYGGPSSSGGAADLGIRASAVLIVAVAFAALMA